MCIDLDYYSSNSYASCLPLFYRRAATEATEATMTWLESAAKRARDRVVSTLPLEVACERESVFPMNETEGRACRQSERT